MSQSTCAKANAFAPWPKCLGPGRSTWAQVPRPAKHCALSGAQRASAEVPYALGPKFLVTGRAGGYLGPGPLSAQFPGQQPKNLDPHIPFHRPAAQVRGLGPQYFPNTPCHPVGGRADGLADGRGWVGIPLGPVYTHGPWVYHGYRHEYRHGYTHGYTHRHTQGHTPGYAQGYTHGYTRGYTRVKAC